MTGTSGGQKFHKGDYVRVAKSPGNHTSHFPVDRDAIVIGSYKDQYGGYDTTSYTLLLEGQGKCSWYEEGRLSMIERCRGDLLNKWENDIEADRKQRSDLDWIFSHGREVIEHRYGASVQSLANCFGLTDLWGSHGEGYTYYITSLQTIEWASPFLLSGDKDGWLAVCKNAGHGASASAPRLKLKEG